MTYRHFQVYPTNSVSPQLTLTLHTMLSWYFCLDPNDINWKNFKILLKQWAYPKSISIFHLNFMTYSHRQVSPTKKFDPTIDAYHAHNAFLMFLSRSKWFKLKEFQNSSQAMSLSKSISIFYLNFMIYSYPHVTHQKVWPHNWRSPYRHWFLDVFVSFQMI